MKEKKNAWRKKFEVKIVSIEKKKKWDKKKTYGTVLCCSPIGAL